MHGMCFRSEQQQKCWIATLPERERTWCIHTVMMLNCSYSDPILLCSDAASTRSIRADGSGRPRMSAIHGGASQLHRASAAAPRPVIVTYADDRANTNLQSAVSVLVRARAGRPSLSAPPRRPKRDPMLIVIIIRHLSQPLPSRPAVVHDRCRH
jgi:hypothetical protein